MSTASPAYTAPARLWRGLAFGFALSLPLWLGVWFACHLIAAFF